MKRILAGFVPVLVLGTITFAQTPAHTPPTPEKPVDMVLRIVYWPLADIVGETAAAIVLVLLVGLAGYLTKDAVPAAMKGLVSFIAGLSGRLFRHTANYRKSVIDRCGKVRVGYKDTDIDVERDYVSLGVRTGETLAVTAVDDALGQYRCLVVRGHPGAGKTTLLKFLAIKYAMKKMKRVHGRHLVPVFIALKDAADSPDLFEYAAELFAMHCRNGKSYLENLLRKGRCMILLDGVAKTRRYQTKIR